MDKQDYEIRLRLILRAMGKNLRQQLGEECVQTRQDISKHEFVRRNERKALSFFKEQRDILYKTIASAQSGMIMRETPDLSKVAMELIVSRSKERLAVLTKLRQEVQVATRKSLRQPDKLVYPKQVVVKSESYSTRESLSDLIEVAQDFVNH